MAFRHTLLNVRLISIIIIILSTAEFTKNNTEFDYNVSNDINLKPLHYDVEITFDIYGNVSFGKCNIIIQINYPTKNITIRSSEFISIINIDLINKDDNQTTPRKYPIIVNVEKFSFINEIKIYVDFTQSVDFLFSGTYILKMIYVPIIIGGKDLFEPFDSNKEKILDNKSIKVLKAKKLFPHWNEPLLKSTFNISIYHYKNYIFLSNMRIRKTVDDINNTLWTHFVDKSSLMSTQHLTIVIINTDIISLTNIGSSTKNIEFWCRKEIINFMQLANNIAQEVAYFLNEKSIKKIPKVCYIVVRDFQYNNRNIWGFILLREEDIIYERLSHIVRKIKVTNFIAHQTISHWYNDVSLWSKEGFITFLAAHILDETQLIYRMMDLFVVQIQQESLRFDTLSEKDSLLLHTVNISTVHSFRASFQYIKSSIIWRMLHRLISDHVFWTSINTYTERQYNQSNVIQTDELWNIMQTNLGTNLHVKDIMNTFITQKNFLQMYVERVYLDNRTTFLLDLDFILYKDTKYSTLVTYVTKSKHFDYLLLTQNKSIWTFYEAFNNYNWIIVNVFQAGYYRVNYNIENWEYLIHQLHENLTQIHVLNRAQIIDDAFYFFMQKHLNFNIFWRIAKFLYKDTDYIAWYPMFKAVEYMMCILAVKDVENSVIQHNIVEILYGLLQNIGYQERPFENDLTKYLREEAIKWACVLGEQECRLLATVELQKNLKNFLRNIPLKWKEWIYCKGLIVANNSIWHEVYEKWQETRDNTFLEYLTCSIDADINQNYLRKTMENEFKYKVSNNNTCANIVFLILAKHAKRDIVLEFILQQLEFVNLSSKKQVDQIAILIVIITHNISVDQFEKISKFVENNLTTSDKRLVNAIEQKINKRKKEHQKRIRNYGSFELF